MAESRQQKAKRLVAEQFNEHGWGNRPVELKEITILWITPDAENKRNWKAVLFIKVPTTMFWEVEYHSKSGHSILRPYLNRGQVVVDDKPAEPEKPEPARKARAAPVELTPSLAATIKARMSAGYTRAQIIRSLGITRTILKQALSGSDAT